MSLRDRWQEHRIVQEELPFYRRSGFLAAAVFVGVVMLAGVVLLLTLGDDGENTATPPGGQVPPVTESPTEATTTTEPPTGDVAATTPPGAEPTAAPPGGGGCELLRTDSGDAALTTAPEVEWSPVGDAPTATSEQDGPLVLDGPKRCYSQTAAGALLAAHNFTADGNSGLVDDLELAQTRVLPTASMYDQLIAEAETPDGSGGGTSVVPVAYRFIAASEAEYQVAIVYQVPGSTGALFVEQRLTVAYVDSDWMIADGVEAEQIDSIPPGYVSWGPLGNAEE